MPKTDMDKPNPFGIFTGGNMGELGRKSPKMVEIRGDPHGENRPKWTKMGKDYPQIWRIIQVSEQFPIQKFATLEKKYLMSNIREKKNST